MYNVHTIVNVYNYIALADTNNKTCAENRLYVILIGIWYIRNKNHYVEYFTITNKLNDS